MYGIINKINLYIEEIYGNKDLILAPTDQRKYTLKIHEELRSKIRNLIIKVSNLSHNSKPSNSSNYVGKFMIFMFNSDDDLPL